MAGKGSQRSILFERFAASESMRVDREKYIIKGVSCLTEGNVKGHSAFNEQRSQSLPVYSDAKTLLTVKDAAETYAGGLKVKMGHDSGAEAIVGSLKSFRIDGAKLLADLHLLESSPLLQYIMEIAEEMPDTFGLSLNFTGPNEFKNDRALVRCTEIYSCDLVDKPAANPGGLFEQGKTQTKNNMPDDNKEKVEELFSEKQLTKLSELIGAEFKKFQEKEGKSDDPAAMMSAKIEEVVKKFQTPLVLETLRTFTKELGIKPGVAAGNTEIKQEQVDDKPRKFEEVVTAKRLELKDDKDPNKALLWCIEHHQPEYKVYRARIEAGERITF